MSQSLDFFHIYFFLNSFVDKILKSLVQEREKAYGDYIEESTAKYAMNPQPVATVGGGKSSIPILGGISKLFG